MAVKSIVRRSPVDARRARARSASRAGTLGCCLVSAGLSLCFPAHSAHAQPNPSGVFSEPDPITAARKHFELGTQLYREGNARGALVELMRAYGIAPSARLLYNIGQAALEARDYATAYDALSRYLAAEPPDLTPARRRMVEADLGAASARVGFLVLETDQDSVEATIDGIAKSLSAAAIPLESGRHEVRVTGRDGTSITRVVDISAGDSTRVRLLRPVQPPARDSTAAGAHALDAQPALPQHAAPAEQLPTPPQASSEAASSKPSPWFWAGLSATATLGVASAVLGAFASSANAEHEALLREVPGDPERIGASKQEVERLATMTDIALGATLIGAASTLTLFLVGDGSSNGPQAHFGLGPGQLRLGGVF